MATRKLEDMPLTFPEVEQWFQILDFHVQANKLTEVKKAVLLSSCGSKAFSLISTLCSPDSVTAETITFDIIKGKVITHLKPKRILHFERHLLHSMVQTDETATLFLQRLKDQASRCDFGSLREELILSQFIFGLKDKRTREKLLADPDLTLDTAVQAALMQETVVIAAKTDAVVALVAAKPSHDAFKPRFDQFTPSNNYKCFSCGEKNHFRKDCRHKNAKCKSCHKIGHLMKVCKNNPTFPSSSNVTSTASDYDVVLSVNNSSDSRPTLLTEKCSLGDTVIDFMLDTGSQVSMIPQMKAEEAGCDICTPSFSESFVTAFGGQKIPIIGVIRDVELTFKSKVLSGTVLVTRNGLRPILGLDFLSKLSSTPENFFCAPVTCNDSKFEASFRLKKDAVLDGMVCSARSLPFSMKVLVENEIKRLLGESIIFPVKDPVMSAPIVPVVKQAGASRPIRLCGDYSKTINRVIDCDSYHIPLLEEILEKISGCEIYSVLDMTDAYLQVNLSPASRMYTCISTHLGHYAYKSLPFGVSSSPLIFQEIIDFVLKGIDGVAVYQDDIILGGASQDEHDARLKQVQERLANYDFKINDKKSQLSQCSVDFLGFVLKAGKLLPQPKKLQAFSTLRMPEDKVQLRSLLGTLRHYGHFCANFSAIARPLYYLLRKDVLWKWTSQHDSAVSKLIDTITDGSISCYDQSKPLYVFSDASKDGLGYVLAHDAEQSEVVWLGSRVLTPAESNYSNIEREALGVVEAVKYFHKFLCGRSFTVVSDHRPLKYIFDNQKVSERVSARLQRWAITLRAYNYQVQYKSGEHMFAADTLSRLGKETGSQVPSVNLLELNALDEFTDNSSLLQQLSQARDKTSDTLKQYIVHGWPSSLSSNLIPYSKNREEYSIQNGIIYKGLRIVPSQHFRKRILHMLHDGHPGITKMLRLARQYVWWPGIDQDINGFVQRCNICQTYARRTTRRGLSSWPEAKDFLDRVHIDLAHFKNQTYLVFIDSATNWADVQEISNLTSCSSIQALRRIFKYIGIPRILVSDNGTNFTGSEFEKFLRDNNIQHVTTPAGHHQSNGKVEKFISTFKFFMVRNNASSENGVIRFCLWYNTTPDAGHGSVPASFVFQKTPRTLMTSRFTEFRPSVQPVPVYVRVETSTENRPGQASKVGSNTNEDERGRLVHDGDLLLRKTDGDAESVTGSEVMRDDSSEEVVQLRRSDRVRREPDRLQYS